MSLWRQLRADALAESWRLRRRCRQMHDRFPFGPLEPILRARYQCSSRDNRSGISIVGIAAAILDTDRRSVYRWQQNGLTVFQADRLACRLGYHPSSLWPEWWAA